jgi:hypothetical protein
VVAVVGMAAWNMAVERRKLMERRDSKANLSGVSGLRGRWGARRRIVEEELLVYRYNERLDVSCCEQRGNERGGSCGRSGTRVCRLANLAGSFVLSFSVRMG